MIIEVNEFEREALRQMITREIWQLKRDKPDQKNSFLTVLEDKLQKARGEMDRGFCSKKDKS
jgi:hypothetical protein